MDSHSCNSGGVFLGMKRCYLMFTGENAVFFALRVGDCYGRKPVLLTARVSIADNHPGCGQRTGHDSLTNWQVCCFQHCRVCVLETFNQVSDKVLPSTWRNTELYKYLLIDFCLYNVWLGGQPGLSYVYGILEYSHCSIASPFCLISFLPSLTLASFCCPIEWSADISRAKPIWLSCHRMAIVLMSKFIVRELYNKEIYFFVYIWRDPTVRPTSHKINQEKWLFFICSTKLSL